jgi:exonuclease III
MIWFAFFLFINSVYSTSFNCSNAPSTVKDLRTNPHKWTLVQYNVEWLFTEPCSSCPGICTWDTTTDQYTHVNTIKDTLADLDGDTIHMCEVQSCTQLDEVKPSDDYRSYMIQGEDTYTGQNVGLITKIDPIESVVRTEERVAYPIVNSQCGYTGDSGTEGVSKHMITRFMINNVSIYLIGAHFLSDPNDPSSCAKREAQAQVLQYKIQSFIEDGNEVVLIGDLNDYDGIYRDINNHVPNSQVLEILKGDVGDDNNYTLYTVASKVLQDGRYTEWYDETPDCVVEKTEYSMIDHILVTQQLWNHIDMVDFYHKYREGCNTYQSDHYPISVTFYWE